MQALRVEKKRLAVRDIEKPLRGVKEHDDATAVLMADGSAVRPAQARSRRPANWRDLIGM